MSNQTDPIAELINLLAALPGVGRKTATRFVYFILKQDAEYVKDLAAALVELKEQVGFCAHCCDLTRESPCRICGDERRDHQTICVVQSPQDVLAIEATGEFRGLYHVLHGILSPLEGKGPDDIKLAELLARLSNGVEEVIVATNPSVEGEATALYIKKLLVPLGVKVSRIASGLPMGSHLEFADKVTLGRSIADRRVL